MDIFTNVINNTLTNLNTVEKNMLEKYYNKLLLLIQNVMNIKNKDDFNIKMKQNNYRDAIGILYLLLPYINDKEDKKYIKTLNDIYIAKKNKNDIDIHKTNPIYKYSNLQYNRCTDKSEIKFSEEHIKDNFYLLCETIRQIGQKMYVNWINVIPYLESEINDKNNDFIKNTYEEFKTFGSKEITPSDYDNNTYGNLHRLQIDDLYDSIVNDLYYAIKDVKWLIYEINMNNKFISIYDYLEFEFGKNFFTQSYETNKNIFDSKFTSHFINPLLNNNSSKANSTLSKESLETLMKGLFIFYNNKADKSSDVSDIDNLIKNQEESDFIINISQIIKIVKSARLENIYNYIQLSIDHYNNTFYSKDYIKTFEKDNISKKNIYNFAKSFCHITDNSNVFKAFPRYWKSMTDDLKSTIYDRLNNTNTSWFNISRYISNILKKNNVSEYQNNIRNGLLKNIIQIVLYNMFYGGRLSKITFENNNLTDERNISSDVKRDVLPKKLKIFQNKNYENSYSFTRKQYKSPTNNTTYLNFNSMNGWYTAYATDYILQLSFFHKYLNNRVIFTTGATGAGKSTIFPQLLLYCLTAIDFRINGIIACSQPRVKPVVDNCNNISKSLGVPINEGNYLIQYNTKDKTSMKQISGNILRLYTDGLLNMLFTNFLLKKQNEDFYLKDNLFDIIIVDESHEHNTNMDYILTFMKYATYFNNSLKLVIVSATMDNDEPIYRRYYRHIDDNRMYPLNTFIQQNNLNRINVDRRLHISAPNQTTRYKIDEHYIDDIKENSIEELIINLTKKYPNDDILVFQKGQGEITTLINNLKPKLPKYTYALPFYSQLDDNKKKIFEDVASYKKKIKYDKSLNLEDVVDISYGNNTCSNIVIIATNIAEASITINTLKFVIDDGKQKSNFYDFITRSEKLIETDISESSREQRRGRVGRVSSGTVYYLYEKGRMERNKILYGIAKENITDHVYRSMKITDSILFDKNTDPNLNSNLNINIYTNESIKEIINLQYFINGIYYNYKGIDDSLGLKVYVDGLDLESVLDFIGKHYIIHPDELQINRNIYGEIVSIDESDFKNLKYNKINKTIDSNKMWSYILDLLSFSLFNGKYTSTSIEINKSEIGKKLQPIITALELPLQHFLCYFYSTLFDCTELVIRFISLLSIIQKPFVKSVTRFSKINNKFIPNSHSHSEKSDILYVIELLNTTLDKYYIEPNGDTFEEKKYNLESKLKELSSSNISTKQIHIKEEFALKYIKSYNRLKNIINCFEKDLFKSKYSDFLSLKKILQINPPYSNEEDNFTTCIMLSFPYNIIYNTTTIMGEELTIDDTFMKNIYTKGYFSFFNLDTETKSVSMLHYIKPELIGQLSNVFEAIHQTKIKNINIRNDIKKGRNNISYKLKKSQSTL